MGASLAFDAGLDRFKRAEYVLLNYHVHIPLPDPMVNPSTLARQSSYGVNSTPSYFIDGDKDGGGGSAANARSIFDSKVDPVVQKHLEAAPEAKIDLRARRAGSTVTVNAKVSKLASKSDKLKLHIVLVEEQVRYSGENGMRFHEMVVRSVATPPAPAGKRPAPADTGEKKSAADATADAKAVLAAAGAAQGFALKPGKGGSVEYTFDLAKVVADGKAHLDDFETRPFRGNPYSFREKKNEVTGTLSVVAFVQDDATKKILQAVYVKAPVVKTTN